MQKEKARQCYVNILRRCGIAKGYENTRVCEEWLNKAKFYDWFLANWPGEGWEIDKDLLGDGSIYSPEYCVFLPTEMNLKINSRSLNAKGYSKDFNRYRVRVQIGNDLVTLGTFDSPETARKAYCAFKIEYLNTSLEKWIGIVPDSVLALIKDKIRANLNPQIG